MACLAGGAWKAVRASDCSSLPRFQPAGSGHFCGLVTENVFFVNPSKTKLMDDALALEVSEERLSNGRHDLLIYQYVRFLGQRRTSILWRWFD